MAMPMNVETEVFTFLELSDEAKESAREWYRQGHLDDEWWDTVYSDFEAICEILGIALKTMPVTLAGGGMRRKPCIYFRGFGSQGDGASFEVECYSHAKGSSARIMAYAPNDDELHAIVQRLGGIQHRNFYRLYARADQRGRYCHENTMHIDVRRDDAAMTADAEEVVCKALRDLARWLYDRLEREYDYLQSDEVVDESLLVNAYTFTATGERFS
jgi:hypothetical protein